MSSMPLVIRSLKIVYDKYFLELCHQKWAPRY
jgi:hypothetical protein